MFNNICADIKRFQRQDERNSISLIWCYTELKTLLTYRLGRWIRNAVKNPFCWPMVFILSPVYWLLTVYLRFACDVILEQSAEIGSGLFIGHFGGIRLRNCRVGSHCSIQQEVHLVPLIGNAEGPTIGNRVWIGAHARILGSVQVGDGATIGAGALVTQDVNAGCLVLGNPGRVMQNDYDNCTLL